MDALRPETEIDRTLAALAAGGLTLPLRDGAVELAAAPVAAQSPVGQRLLTVAVNELARMKGVVSRMHVTGLRDEPILPGTPLTGSSLADGLHRLVTSLNAPGSDLLAAIEFAPATHPAARLRIGPAPGDGLEVAADGWRALLGRHVIHADWAASAPYGAALAAALAAAEAYKLILAANGAADPAHRLIEHLTYSAYNHGIDQEALAGPAVHALTLPDDLAVAGCGAGGSGALYVLAMQPGLTGDVALVEPGRHKLSNLNRYLMTSAADVHDERHKLASAIHHLSLFAPGLRPTTYPKPWEQLDTHPWGLVLSTVDTVEARWSIQARGRPGAILLDGAVNGLLYALLRVAPGGRCLECIHPYDPDLAIKQRAARWGQPLETIKTWTAADRPVTPAMIDALARTQNRPAADYAALEGVPFTDTPRLTECGATALRADVPSQAPVLPIATTPVGALLAAEIAKQVVAPEAALANSLAHDLGRGPGRPRVKWRPPRAGCLHH